MDSSCGFVQQLRVITSWPLDTQQPRSATHLTLRPHDGRRSQQEIREYMQSIGCEMFYTEVRWLEGSRNYHKYYCTRDLYWVRSLFMQQPFCAVSAHHLS